MSEERELPDVDGYLNQVCWAMGGSFSEQQAVRGELRSHLREAARDFVTGGMPAREALTSALHDLGDPAEVGRAMRRSRGTKPLRRPVVQPAGALLLHMDRLRNLPGLRLTLALAALVATPPLVALAYAWPG